MRKGRDGGEKKEKKIMKKIVATNVVASRPPNGDRLQRRPLVPIRVYKGFYYSYQNYMDHLTQALHYERHNFSEVQKKNLKLSFGIRYKENFTLLRFPECRKNRTKKSEPNSKSAWQKQVWSSYIDNPVGSYQGHYDKPMNGKVNH